VRGSSVRNCIRAESTIDFWELPKARLTSSIADSVESNFYKRCPPEKRPRHLRELVLETQRKSDIEEKRDEEKGEEKGEETWTGESNNTAVPEKTGKKPKHDESLFKALHRTFFTQIWISGVFKLVAGEFMHSCDLVSC